MTAVTIAQMAASYIAPIGLPFALFVLYREARYLIAIIRGY